MEKYFLFFLFLHSIIIILLACNTCVASSNDGHHHHVKVPEVFIDSSFLLQLYLCDEGERGGSTYNGSSNYSHANANYLHHQHSSPLILVLDNSREFSLPPNTFCIITNRSVELRVSNPRTQARITCYHDDDDDANESRFGIYGVNSTIVLRDLSFLNCGMNFNYHLNHSQDLTPSHSVTFFFVYCRVFITNVRIFSRGFAMIGINLYDSTLDQLSVSNQKESFKFDEYYGPSIGSGIKLFFKDISHLSRVSYKVNITHSNFTHNYNMDHGFNAAGLTISNFTSQTLFRAEIVIADCYFYKNTAALSGGLLILQSHLGLKTIIINSTFEENFNLPLSASGAGIAFLLFTLKVPPSNNKHFVPLEFINCTFLNHRPAHIIHPYGPEKVNHSDGGAIYLGVPNYLNSDTIVEIIFLNSTFLHNVVAWSGACIFATGYSNGGSSSLLHSVVVITMENTIARNNSNIALSKQTATESGVFVFYGFKCIKIHNAVFENHLGIVLLSLDTSIVLAGNVIFANNQATFGPAITQSGVNCQIYFMSGVNASFINNTALVEGGAIYTTGHSQGQLGLCAIQIINSNNTSITFINNNAQRAGSSIFAQPLTTCIQNGKLINHNKTELMEYYYRFFDFTSPVNSTLLDMSTDAIYILLENGHDHFYIYPGQDIHLCLYGFAYPNGNVHTVVIIELKCYTLHGDKHCPLWIDRSDSEKIIEESRHGRCTNISFGIRTKNDTTPTEGIFFLSANGGKPNVAAIHTTELNLPTKVAVLPCPLGFILNPITGSCTCSTSFYDMATAQPSLLQQVDCNLTTQTISRAVSTNSWAGIATKGSTQVSVSLSCPISYCNSNKSLAYFYSNFTSTFNESFMLTDSRKTTHHSLCLHNRVGPICGQCGVVEGHKQSAIFGSNECKHCTNWWLFTILIYALAGPLLIVILYALKLTLTSGTLNGIIFYAQAANCGLLDIFDTYCNIKAVERLSKFSQVFVFLLNTNMPFGLCFYDGMTEIWKAGLSLLFPLYLLAIIGFIVILCHFYVRLANKIAGSSVQVLVTVLHLSFSRLLLQLINVFSSATIYSPNHTTRQVWLFDGSIEYWSTPHIILITVTLVVVLTLLLPYMTLLIFAKPLRPLACTNNYLRPFLEAIHAPYREGQQYWFTLRLVLVCGMFLIYAFYRGTNVFLTYVIINPILLLFMIAQSYVKPFQSTAINTLDTCLMINFIVFNLTSWYFYLKDQTVAMKSFTIGSVMITFITFIFVLVYHVLLVTGVLKRCKGHFNKNNDNATSSMHCGKFFNKITSSFCGRRQNNTARRGRQLLRNVVRGDGEGDEMYYEECDIPREPLLEGDTNMKAAD